LCKKMGLKILMLLKCVMRNSKFRIVPGKVLNFAYLVEKLVGRGTQVDFCARHKKQLAIKTTAASRADSSFQ